MYLKCIKGIADKTNVVCLQGDVVEVTNIEEGEVNVFGVNGWCKGHEINISSREIAECFCVWQHNNITFI